MVIAGLIVVVVIVMVLLWLVFNVVIPLVLLNVAVICTIAAYTTPERRRLFAALALAGACYMLADIANGWWSANFVNHVVKSPAWLTAIVYLNAAAAAASVWFLVDPLLASPRRRTWLSVAVGGAVAAAALLPAAFYHFGPNAFRSVAVPATPATAEMATVTDTMVGVPPSADTMATEVILLEPVPPAETPSISSAGMIQPDVSEPVVIPSSRVDPKYSEVAWKARIEGSVVVECSIDEEGNVVGTRVVKPLPFGLDAAAVHAVRRWKFQPARRNGLPVPSTYEAVVVFNFSRSVAESSETPVLDKITTAPAVTHTFPLEPEPTPPEPAVVTSTASARVSPHDSIDVLQTAIDNGAEVSFPVKRTNAAPGYVHFESGTITVSRTGLTIHFYLPDDVSPETISGVSCRPPRLSLRVREMQMARNQKMREVKTEYLLYDIHSEARGVARDGRITTRYYDGNGNIVCDGCDDTMSKLCTLIDRLRPAGR